MLAGVVIQLDEMTCLYMYVCTYVCVFLYVFCGVHTWCFISTRLIFFRGSVVLTHTYTHARTHIYTHSPNGQYTVSSRRGCCVVTVN